jgi:hypothetical protein
MAGHSESGNEPLGSIKHLKFDSLKMYLLLKKTMLQGVTAEKFLLCTHRAELKF